MPRGRGRNSQVTEEQKERSRNIQRFVNAVRRRNLREVEETIGYVSQEKLNESLVEACDGRDKPINTDIIDRIIDAGADVTYPDGRYGALGFITCAAYPRVMEKIMNISMPSPAVFTEILKWVVLYGDCRLSMLHKLIHEGGADINYNEGELLSSLSSGHPGRLRMLLEAGANPNLRNSRQCLHKMLTRRNTEAVRILLEAGAEVADEDIGMMRELGFYVNTTEEQKERRIRAIQIEAENEAKRQAALEEYKSTANMDTQPTELKVNTYCYPGSHNTLMGDTLRDSDDFVIFIEEGTEKGDCYLRTELKEIYGHTEMYEFAGPPFRMAVGEYRGPRGPIFAKPIFRLPWTSVWIDKEAMDHAIEGVNNIIILKGVKQSIGSEHGSIMGQLGGHWAREEDTAIYVEDGNAEPDERPIIYRYVRSESV